MIIQAMSIFATAFVVALSGAMMPGPLLTVTVARVARHGFWQSVFLMLGHAILELALVLGLLLGLRSVLENHLVLIFFGLAGGVALVWMGFDIIRKIRDGQLHLKLDATPVRQEASSATLGGVIASLSNPYWIVWWVTIGMGYIVLAAKYGLIGITGFYLGHISGDFAWYGLIGAMVSGGRQYLSDKLYQGFLFACGLFLIGLGVYFFGYAIIGI